MTDNGDPLLSIQVSDILGLGKIADSKSATRLIDAISFGVSRTLGPWLMKREAQTLLSIQKATDEALADRFSGEMTLGDRARMRLTFDRAVKQENRELIARNAIESLMNPQLESESTVDIDTDWLIRFWDYAEKVSKPEMQILWGKVLSRKSIFPEEISPRTLALLSTLTYEEARMVEAISPFVIGISTEVAGFSTTVGGILNNVGQYQGTFAVPSESAKEFEQQCSKLIPEFDRIALDSAGVMQSANGWASEYGFPYSKSIDIKIGNTRFSIDGFPQPNARYLKWYSFGSGSGFTREGFDLVAISGVKADSRYQKAFQKVLMSAKCNLHEVIEG